MAEDFTTLLEVIRKNTANDLHYSNEILAVVDKILEYVDQSQSDKKAIEELAERLVKIASQLTDQSSVASVLIAKLMGAAR